MEAMTLERIVERMEKAPGYSPEREKWIAGIRAHLAQVDVGALQKVADDLACVARLTDHDLTRGTCQSASDRITRALSGEKAGPVGDGKWCDCGKVRLPHLKGEFIACHYYCKCDGCGSPVIGGPYGFPDVLCRACALPASPTPDKEGEG